MCSTWCSTFFSKAVATLSDSSTYNDTRVFHQVFHSIQYFLLAKQSL